MKYISLIEKENANFNSLIEEFNVMTQFQLVVMDVKTLDRHLQKPFIILKSY